MLRQKAKTLSVSPLMLQKDIGDVRTSMTTAIGYCHSFGSTVWPICMQAQKNHKLCNFSKSAYHSLRWILSYGTCVETRREHSRNMSCVSRFGVYQEGITSNKRTVSIALDPIPSLVVRSDILPCPGGTPCKCAASIGVYLRALISFSCTCGINIR